MERAQMVGKESYTFKIIVLGPASVGKTTLMRRFVDNKFVSDIIATIGVDFSLKQIELEEDSNRQITLQIWDMAGETRYHNVLPQYMMGAKGVILVFDATNPRTLKEIYDWFDVVKKHLPRPNIPIILISTKHDLKIEITPQNIIEFKNYSKITKYFETSSKTGQNVNQVFIEIARDVVHSLRKK